MGWKKIKGKTTTSWYYFNQNGVMQVGWKLIGGKYYHFDSEGRMQTGWVKQGGAYYYLAPKTGAAVVGDQKINGKWYYFDKNSLAMKTGWIYIDGEQYYFKPATGAMATGWANINNEWYYFKSNGTKTYGLARIGSAFYCFDDYGKMRTKSLVDSVEIGTDGKCKSFTLGLSEYGKSYSFTLRPDGSITGKYSSHIGDDEGGYWHDETEFKGTFSNFKSAGKNCFSMKLNSFMIRGTFVHAYWDENGNRIIDGKQDYSDEPFVTPVYNSDDWDLCSEFVIGDTFYLYVPYAGKSEMASNIDTSWGSFDNTGRLKNCILDNPKSSRFSPSRFDMPEP